MPQRRLLASSLAGLLALVGSPLLDRASVAQAQDEADCEEAGCASADVDGESAAEAEDWDESAQGEDETADEQPAAEEGTGSAEEEESDGEEPADNGAVAENAEPTEPTTPAPEPPGPPEPAEPPAPAATPTPAVPTPAPAPQADATATRADLRNFVARQMGGQQVSDSDDIFALGLVNSLFAMQLVNFCEQKFDIEITPENFELDNFRSINAMVALIERSRRR